MVLVEEAPPPVEAVTPLATDSAIDPLADARRRFATH